MFILHSCKDYATNNYNPLKIFTLVCKLCKCNTFVNNKCKGPSDLYDKSPEPLKWLQWTFHFRCFQQTQLSLSLTSVSYGANYDGQAKICWLFVKHSPWLQRDLFQPWELFFPLYKYVYIMLLVHCKADADAHRHMHVNTDLSWKPHQDIFCLMPRTKWSSQQ